jgi:hypothetical protein
VLAQQMFGDLDLTIEVKEQAGKLWIDVGGAVTDDDTLELRFRSPIQVDAGGGSLALSTAEVLFSPDTLEPGTRVERRLEISADFNDPGYQQLGLLAAPVPFDGLTDDRIELVLVVNDDVELEVELAPTSLNDSVDDLVMDLQGAIDSAITLWNLANPLNTVDGFLSAGGSAVTAVRVDPEGNRIEFRGKQGEVDTLSISVPATLAGGTANGAISELGFVAGDSGTVRAKASQFFLEDVGFGGSFSLVAEDLALAASLGFLGIEAEGSGTIGDASIAVGGQTPGSTTRQIVTLSGVAPTAGGGFTLTIPGGIGDAAWDVATSVLAFDAPATGAGSVQAALEAAIASNAEVAAKGLAPTVTGGDLANGVRTYSIEFATDPGLLLEAEGMLEAFALDDQLVVAGIDLALRNPEDAGSRLSIAEIGDSLKARNFLFDSSAIAAGQSTGVLDGAIAGELGFELSIAPSGFLSGLDEALNVAVEVGFGSPNWLVALPTFGDVLGLGDATTDDGSAVDGTIDFDGLAGADTTFTLGVEAPTNGQLESDFSFVLSMADDTPGWGVDLIGPAGSTDRIQRIALTGGDGGFFTLSLGPDTTDAIGFAAGPDDLRDALNAALTGGATVDAVMLDTTGGQREYTIEFDVSPGGSLSADVSGVVPGTNTAAGSLDADETRPRVVVTRDGRVQTVRVENASGGTFELQRGATAVTIDYQETAASIALKLAPLGAVSSVVKTPDPDSDPTRGDVRYEITFASELETLQSDASELTRDRVDLQTDLQAAFDEALADLLGVAFDPALPQVTVEVDPFHAIRLQGADGISLRSTQIDVEITGSDFDQLLSLFDGLSFDNVLAGLRLAVDFLKGLDGSDGSDPKVEALTVELPFINRSISDLLNPADDLLAFVERVAADPAGSVQQLNDLLASALGFSAPTVTSSAGAGVNLIALGTADAGGSDTNLVDADIDFLDLGVQVGDEVTLDGGQEATVTAVSADVLTTTALTGATWANALYEIRRPDYSTQTVRVDSTSGGSYTLSLGDATTGPIDVVLDGANVAGAVAEIEAKLNALFGPGGPSASVSEYLILPSGDVLSNTVTFDVTFTGGVDAPLQGDATNLGSLDVVSLDLKADSGPLLKIDFGLDIGAALSRPFDLDVAGAIQKLIDDNLGGSLPSFLSELTSLVGVDTAGTLSVDAGLDLDLAFGVDLTGNDKSFFLRLDDTGFEASARAAVSDLDFSARLGPFGIFVIDGDASLDAGIGLDLTDADDDQRLELVRFVTSVDVDEKTDGDLSVQQVSVLQGKGGSYTLSLGDLETDEIALDAPATGAGSVEERLDALSGVDVSVARVDLGVQTLDVALVAGQLPDADALKAQLVALDGIDEGDVEIEKLPGNQYIIEFDDSSPRLVAGSNSSVSADGSKFTLTVDTLAGFSLGFEVDRFV